MRDIFAGQYLQEIEEGEVCGSCARHFVLLLLETLERLDGVGEVLLAEEHDGLVDLQVVGELRVCGQLDRVHAPVVARAEGLLDHGRDELGRGQDGVLGLVPPRALDLAEVVILDGLEDEVGHGVVRDGEILVLVLHLERNLAELSESFPHPVFVPGGVVTQYKMQSCLKISLLRHNPLE